MVGEIIERAVHEILGFRKQMVRHLLLTKPADLRYCGHFIAQFRAPSRPRRVALAFCLENINQFRDSARLQVSGASVHYFLDG